MLFSCVEFSLGGYVFLCRGVVFCRGVVTRKAVGVQQLLFHVFLLFCLRRGTAREHGGAAAPAAAAAAAERCEDKGHSVTMLGIRSPFKLVEAATSKGGETFGCFLCGWWGFLRLLCCF